MSQLQDFPPCDPDRAQLDWICGPCGQTRDSEPLEEANFESAQLELYEVDPNQDDWEIICWRHWACGWVEEIFVRPGTKAAAVQTEMKNRLATYPCLNEHILAEKELRNVNS